MKYCPMTYEAIPPDERYSKKGLRLLSPKLKDLKPLNWSAHEQRQEAIARAPKMSIQGVQFKLSARLNIKESCFEIVDQFGHFILKPQSEYYPELPENEALTMTLAKIIGIEVPVHGLIYAKDESMTYFIKRFDRKAHHQKAATEDFTQLLQLNREKKYESSMEKVAKVIKTFCSFPKIESMELLKRTVFNFLVGNEDMHLKNFSLITKEQKVMLSPAYDLLNTTIAQRNTPEELALTLNGKKNNLKKNDLWDYFGAQQLHLNRQSVDSVMMEIKDALPHWKRLISRSFLSKNMQQKYLELLDARCSRLF